jgi:serine/threonine protein kinase
MTAPDLKKLLKHRGLELGGKKQDYIDRLRAPLKKYKGYEIIKQLGSAGADGVAFLAAYVPNRGKLVVLKTFKDKKSAKSIQIEADFQSKAAKHNLAPEIYEVNIKDKYIAMGVMDGTFKQYIIENGGKVPLEDQKKILKLFQGLDDSKIHHFDSNPLNLMYKGSGKNRVWKVIDFGISKKFMPSDKDVNIDTLHRMMFTGYLNISKLYKERPDYLYDHTKKGRK